VTFGVVALAWQDNDCSPPLIRRNNDISEVWIVCWRSTTTGSVVVIRGAEGGAEHRYLGTWAGGHLGTASLGNTIVAGLGHVSECAWSSFNDSQSSIVMLNIGSGSY
jgi:hypothetical protein